MIYCLQNRVMSGLEYDSEWNQKKRQIKHMFQALSCRSRVNRIKSVTTSLFR